jgi:ACR3 family arsenite transporter
MSNVTAASTQEQPSLGLVGKLLPLWIILAMAAGLLVGRFLPQVGKALEPGIPLGLFVMIYPAMTKLELGEIRKAVRDWKAAAIVIFFNYTFNPFLLYLFGWIFLRNHPDLWTGLVLLGVAPCIAMVLVWTDLARGNGPLGIVLMAWNSLIQMVTTPFFIWLILGARVSVDIGLVAQSVVLYLGLPLLTGALSRRWMLQRKGPEWFEKKALPVLDDIQLIALTLTLVVMFALQGDVILEHPELIWQMATPLVLFFFVLFFGVLMVSRKVGFCYADSATTSFHCTGRNFELAIAIALTAFASRPMVGVSTVIGPLIEVPLMLTIVYLARKSEWKLFGTNTAGLCQAQEAQTKQAQTSSPT